MDDIHLTKKDFRIQWYSGSGAGGQHRNKHQNCCRITHIDSGLSAIGTSSKERRANQREAFNALAKRVITHLTPRESRKICTAIIRNYNEYRNEVHDKASGLKMPWKSVMNDIGPMIEARRKAELVHTADTSQ
jgi:protein subunit release factor B